MSHYIDEFKPDAEDLDPLTNAAAVDFPFEQVFADLDGEEAKPDYPPALLNAVRVIIIWLVSTTPGDAGALEHMGKRTLAFAWAVDPNLFDGAPSMNELGRRLVVASRNMQRLASLAAQHFGSANRQQRPKTRGISIQSRGKESLFANDSAVVAPPSDPLARENKKSMPHAPSTLEPHE